MALFKNKNRKPGEKTRAGKVWDKSKVATLVTARNAFLLLLKLNVWDIAKKIDNVRKTDKAKWENLKKKWKQFGGNQKALEKNIDRGKGKKPIIVRFKKKTNSADGWDDYDTYVEVNNEQMLYPTGIEEAAVAVLNSLPVLIPALAAIGGTVTALTGNPEDAREMEAAASKSDIANMTEEELELMGQDNKEGEFPQWAWYAIGGAALIGIGLAVYFTTRKKK